LLEIADLSGVSDDALRQMHLDHQPAPLALADALRLYEANQQVGRLIDQVERGTRLDDSYLLTLPMLTQMPRWPSGQMLEVFDGPQLSGPSRLFGAQSGAIEARRVRRSGSPAPTCSTANCLRAFCNAG
jgi:hypothetical protein